MHFLLIWMEIVALCLIPQITKGVRWLFPNDRGLCACGLYHSKISVLCIVKRQGYDSHVHKDNIYTVFSTATILLLAVCCVGNSSCDYVIKRSGAVDNFLAAVYVI